jgi:saccharopine dehydrogenase-like NADP-dependent oxidoreductase
VSARRVTVLGGGRVGGAMALDLARDGQFDVRVADASEETLARLAAAGLATVRADLASAEEIRRVVADADLVVGSVPGFLGFAALRAVLEADKDVVDISFFDQDPFLLDELARARGRVAIVDCGVAPGIPNMVAGRLGAELDRLDRFVYYVGGLPAVRRWPYEYKAGFSPIDVLEEYTRPARLVERGEVVVRPALSEPELVDFPELGTLEAFNTDGLRTVLKTITCSEMKEKTLRYPGHIALMRVLRETGFFGKEPIDVRGVRVAPIDLTAALLFPMWRFEEGEADVTVLRIEIEGVTGESRRRFVWELVDRYDEATRTTSMARTTGYTATAAVRLLASGAWKRPGIVPPEHLGADARCFRAMLDDLAAHGVRIASREEPVSG